MRQQVARRLTRVLDDGVGSKLVAFQGIRAAYRYRVLLRGWYSWISVLSGTFNCRTRLRSFSARFLSTSFVRTFAKYRCAALLAFPISAVPLCLFTLCSVPFPADLVETTVGFRQTAGSPVHKGEFI